MNSCDCAISVEDFLHQPTVANYSYITQPPNINNWIALFENDKIIPILIENAPSIKTDFNDSELLTLGHLSIEPLLAEDWNSPEDDVWDLI